MMSLKKSLKTVAWLGLSVFLFGPIVQAAIRERETRGFVLFGGRSFGLAPINSVITAEGAPALSETMFLFGGGGYVLINGRLLLGGEGYMLGRQTAPSDGGPAELAGAAGFFDIGYAILNRRTFRMTPVWGIGGGSLSLTLPDETGSQLGAVKMTHSGMLLKTGLFVETFLNWGKGGLHKQGLQLGISAGYLFSPGRREWKTNGRAVPGGFDVGLSGLYICFMMGAGGKR